MIDNLNVKYNIPFLIPEQYNDAMSYQELLYAVIDKLNAVIDSVNSVPDEIATDVNKQLTEIIDSGLFDEKITRDVTRQLTEIIDSGFFDEKITNIVNSQIDDINAKINENSVNIANEWKKIYPVGSYYISENSTSPSTLFGGTWEQIKDRFLLASGSTYTAGTTGGSASVTLTEAQMPRHLHKNINVDTTRMSWCAGKVAAGTEYGVLSNIVSATNPIYVDFAGSGEPHDNMPPYLAVYVWKRTA